MAEEADGLRTPMAEELRFFVRLAIYLVIADTIYWFATYEWAGSVLMGTLALGAVFFAVAAGATARGLRSDGEGYIPAFGKGLPRGSHTYGQNSEPASGPRGLIRRLDRTLGFNEPQRNDGPLDIEDEPIPPSSIWPLVASLGGLLLALGLVYGAWFWLPGAGVLLLSTWGWVTELTP